MCDATGAAGSTRWCSVLCVTGRLPILLVLVGLLSLPLSSGLVWASDDSEGRLVLSWDAPAGCASREEIEGEIARLLGGRVAISHGGDLDARATVEHPRNWSVKLATRHAGRTGRRSIEAPSCESAAQATALIIALMIDPDAVAAHAHEGTEAVPAVAIPPVAVAAPNEPPRDRRVEILASVHSQVSLGTLPDVDVGVGLGLGLSGRRWQAELRGTYGARRNQVRELPSAAAGAYGQFNITTGALAGCYRLGQSGFAWGPCAVVEGGLGEHWVADHAVLDEPERLLRRASHAQRALCWQRNHGKTAALPVHVGMQPRLSRDIVPLRLLESGGWSPRLSAPVGRKSGNRFLPDPAQGAIGMVDTGEGPR